MTFSQLLDVASAHCVWHFSPCECSGMWSPPVYSSSYSPLSSLSWLRFPGDWTTGMQRRFSHVCPLIRVACMYMRGLLVCLFACLLVCAEQIFRRNPEIEKMAQLWSMCFLRFVFWLVVVWWFCQCPRLWVVTEQGSMADVTLCYLCTGGLWWLSLPSGSPPIRQRSLWHWLWTTDTPGAQLTAANRDTLQQQTHRLGLFSSWICSLVPSYCSRDMLDRDTVILVP